MLYILNTIHYPELCCQYDIYSKHCEDRQTYFSGQRHQITRHFVFVLQIATAAVGLPRLLKRSKGAEVLK